MGIIGRVVVRVAVVVGVVADMLRTAKARLVGVDAAQRESLRRQYPFYTVETLSAGAYSDLLEELVYRFTKAIFDNLGQFHAADAAAKRLTLPTAVSGMPISLHPGAARFFRERGVNLKEGP